MMYTFSITNSIFVKIQPNSTDIKIIAPPRIIRMDRADIYVDILSKQIDRTVTYTTTQDGYGRHT